MLIDRITGVFDRHALEVACRDDEPEREAEVHFLDGRRDEELLQILPVLDGVWRRVDFPGQGQSMSIEYRT